MLKFIIKYKYLRLCSDMKLKKYIAPKAELIEFEIAKYCEGPSQLPTITPGEIPTDDDWIDI